MIKTRIKELEVGDQFIQYGFGPYRVMSKNGVMKVGYGYGTSRNYKQMPAGSNEHVLKLEAEDIENFKKGLL